MTACWCVALFFASAGASSAYLTVSEIFPMETRATAIAFSIGAILMIGGGVAELFLGVKAERQSLESIAQPLTAEEGAGDGNGTGHEQLQTA